MFRFFVVKLLILSILLIVPTASKIMERQQSESYIRLMTTRELYNCGDFISQCTVLSGVAYDICVKCSKYLSSLDCTWTQPYQTCATQVQCDAGYLPPAQCPAKSSSLSTGAVVGIVIGSVAGFIIIALIIRELKRRQGRVLALEAQQKANQQQGQHHQFNSQMQTPHQYNQQQVPQMMQANVNTYNAQLQYVPAASPMYQRQGQPVQQQGNFVLNPERS